jgi:hypothetical protein
MGALLAQLDLSLPGWMIAVACGLMVGFAKTGIGGLGVVVVPLMAMIFPAQRSPGILLPMLIAGDVVAISYYHRHARWRHLLRPMPWAVLGVLVGFAVAKWCPWTDQAYARLIGSIVLVCVILRYWQSRSEGETPVRTEHFPFWLAASVGVSAGFATMVANAAGPIWMIYLLALGLPKFELVGTGAWFFFVLNCFKVPFQWNLGNITAASLALNATLLPAILAGAALGIFVLKRIDQKLFRSIILWLAAVAAAKLLLWS